MSFTNKNASRCYARGVVTSAWREMYGNGPKRGDGGDGFNCTEVMISSTCSTGVLIADSHSLIDGNYATNHFFIPNGAVAVISGVTNCNELSAKAVGGGGEVHYQARHYNGYTLAAG